MLEDICRILIFVSGFSYYCGIRTQPGDPRSCTQREPAFHSTCMCVCVSGYMHLSGRNGETNQPVNKQDYLRW